MHAQLKRFGAGDLGRDLVPERCFGLADFKAYVHSAVVADNLPRGAAGTGPAEVPPPGRSACSE